MKTNLCFSPRSKKRLQENGILYMSLTEKNKMEYKRGSTKD